MNTVKKIMITAIALFLMFISLLYGVFLAEYNLDLKLIDEIEYEDERTYSYGEKYFFIKEEKNLVLYDGETLLEYYLPNYDFSILDTQNHTYFVLLDGKDPNIKYDGMHCNLRKALFLPAEYIAHITYTGTDDGVVRIYEAKKINIDYDYHQ